MESEKKELKVKISPYNLQHNTVIEVVTSQGVKEGYFKRYLLEPADSKGTAETAVFSPKLEDIILRHGTDPDECYLYFTNSDKDSTKFNKIHVISYSEKIKNIQKISAVSQGPATPFILALQDEIEYLTPTVENLESRVEYLETKLAELIDMINKRREKERSSKNSQHKLRD